MRVEIEGVKVEIDDSPLAVIIENIRAVARH